MREIHYYVAVSLDGFIADDKGQTKDFLAEGEHVSEYLADLQNYGAVLMGRLTYEAGYDYGLKPGQMAYPWMQNYIVSDSLQFSEQAEGLQIIMRKQLAETVQTLREADDPAPIYLCGGGVLAGLMLEQNWIDRLILKVNPHRGNRGRPLFESDTGSAHWQLEQSKVYSSGVIKLEYVRSQRGTD